MPNIDEYENSARSLSELMAELKKLIEERNRQKIGNIKLMEWLCQESLLPLP
jgi:hypothetical protein